MADITINSDQLWEEIGPVLQNEVIEWVKKSLTPEEWAQVKISDVAGELKFNFDAPPEITAKIQLALKGQNPQQE